MLRAGALPTSLALLSPFANSGKMPYTSVLNAVKLFSCKSVLFNIN